MAYTELSATLIKSGKSLLYTLFDLLSANFVSHEARILSLETTVRTFPVGVILKKASAVVPSGYLACDGAAVSRVTYGNLFLIIGVTYGSGDGSSTFNVPDLRGRVPIGVGTGSGLTARALADTAGEETHVVTEAELGAHTHVVTDAGHTHMFPFVGAGTGGTVPAWMDAAASKDADLTAGNVTPDTGLAQTGITLQNTGGAGSHNNMQPFVVCNYVIKA